MCSRMAKDFFCLFHMQFEGLAESFAKYLSKTFRKGSISNIFGYQGEHFRKSLRPYQMDETLLLYQGYSAINQ